MQANDLPILDFIRNAFQLRLPLYQRWYDWTTDHCDRLLEDALRTGSDRAIDNHYVGTITTMLPHDAKRTASHPLTVVDGQQRLATLSLLLGAIAETIPGADAPDGFTPDKIRARYLVLARKPIRVILINDLESISEGEVCAVPTRLSVGRSLSLV